MSLMLNGRKKMPKSDLLTKDDKALGYREIVNLKMRASLSADMTVMLAAVKKAQGGFFRDFFEIEQNKAVSRGLEVFVKSARQRTEKVLREQLEKTRPGVKFEIVALDGEENMLHALPFFGFGLRLEKEGETVVEVMNLPLLDQIYYAEKNKGAFMAEPRGARRLRVSENKTPEKAIIAGKDRDFGCVLYHIANVAAGRMDAVIASESFGFGKLLIEEAGGRAVLSQKGIYGANEKIFSSLRPDGF